jgi:hypothetical protein
MCTESASEAAGGRPDPLVVAVSPPVWSVVSVTDQGVESERRAGECGEHQRVLGHRRRHGLPAGHAGADQLEHVGRVQPGTRGTLRGSAVPAPHPGDSERLVAARVVPDDPPVLVSIVREDPTSRIGLTQFHTRANASDHPSKSDDPTKSATCRAVEASTGASPADVSAPRSPKTPRPGRVSWTRARVRVDACPSPRGHRPHHPVREIRDPSRGSRRGDRRSADARPHPGVATRTKKFSVSVCCGYLVCGPKHTRGCGQHDSPAARCPVRNAPSCRVECGSGRGVSRWTGENRGHDASSCSLPSKLAGDHLEGDVGNPS